MISYQFLIIISFHIFCCFIFFLYARLSFSFSFFRVLQASRLRGIQNLYVTIAAISNGKSITDASILPKYKPVSRVFWVNSKKVEKKYYYYIACSPLMAMDCEPVIKSHFACQFIHTHRLLFDSSNMIPQRRTNHAVYNCCPGWAKINKHSHGCTKRKHHFLFRNRKQVDTNSLWIFLWIR